MLTTRDSTIELDAAFEMAVEIVARRHVAVWLWTNDEDEFELTLGYAPTSIGYRLVDVIHPQGTRFTVIRRGV